MATDGHLDPAPASGGTTIGERDVLLANGARGECTRERIKRADVLGDGEGALEQPVEDEAQRSGRLHDQVFEELVVLLERGQSLEAGAVGRAIDMVRNDERPSEVFATEVRRQP